MQQILPHPQLSYLTTPSISYTFSLLDTSGYHPAPKTPGPAPLSKPVQRKRPHTMSETRNPESAARAASQQRPIFHTLNDLFLSVAAGNRPSVLSYQNQHGLWQPLSSAQLYQRVRALAAAFQRWGIQRGDRIGILSENRWEWPVTDFATLALGAIDVPIYPTLTSDQIADLMRDSAARILVVSTRAQYDKAAAIRSQTALEHVVLMDDSDCPADAVAFSSLVADADSRGSQRDPSFDALVAQARPDEVATLIYTSGTTGEPKGVMLSHGNIASNINIATHEYDINSSDSCISFLPLSHITARALDYHLFSYGASIAYCPQFDKLPVTMKQISPTVFVGVPRIYEKIRQGVEQKSGASPIKKRILGWAVNLGASHREAIFSGRTPASPLWKLAQKLVYSKIREAFGGRVRLFISGGAPLGMETGNWFGSVGIHVMEGYGLTETSPVIAINSPVISRMGSVGRVLPGVETTLAPDGELLVRGPSIFLGYWQKPEATRECISPDGWFSTGDIARFDDDGFLYITDRKKELLKTSGGKLIAPQPIEGRLKANILVAHAALVGDKHKYISVVLSPNFAALEAWASEHGVVAPTRRELVADPRVVDLYGAIVAEVNKTLANFETLKRFRVVAEEWALDTGELTPSLKLKRRVITQNYAAIIAEMYADEATSRGA